MKRVLISFQPLQADGEELDTPFVPRNQPSAEFNCLGCIDILSQSLVEDFHTSDSTYTMHSCSCMLSSHPGDCNVTSSRVVKGVRAPQIG